MSQAEGSVSSQARGRQRELVGIVVSDKMNKTRVIEIERRVKHGFYLKRIIAKSRLFVHDEKNESKVGDRIRVVETRPLSRHKSFRLEAVVTKKAEK